MPGQPYFRLFTCAILLLITGCQSGKMNLPWLSSFGQKQNAEYSVANGHDLKPAVSENNFEDVPETANTNSETVVASAERVEQLIRDGQATLHAATSTNPPDSYKLAEAQKLLTEAVTLSPENSNAHHSLAIVADLKQDWAAAEKHYKQALTGNKQDASLLNDLGYSYLLQNRFHEAEQFLNQAMAVNPEHENARFNMALLTLRKGNRNEALAQLTQLAGPGEAQNLITRMESELAATQTVSTNEDIPELPSIPRDASFEEALQIAEEVGRRERQQREQQTAQSASSRFQQIQQWPQTQQPITQSGQHPANLPQHSPPSNTLNGQPDNSIVTLPTHLNPPINSGQFNPHSSGRMAGPWCYFRSTI